MILGGLVVGLIQGVLNYLGSAGSGSGGRSGGGSISGGDFDSFVEIT